MSFSMEGILQGMAECESRQKIAVNMLAETIAKRIEGKAKSGAKWTDRTGHARQRMTSYVTHPGINTVRINLAHGVDYGIWLEMANEKKYAIVEPTIRLESPDAMKSFEKLMDRLK